MKGRRGRRWRRRSRSQLGWTGGWGSPLGWPAAAGSAGTASGLGSGSCCWCALTRVVDLPSLAIPIEAYRSVLTPLGCVQAAIRALERHRPTEPRRFVADYLEGGGGGEALAAALGNQPRGTRAKRHADALGYIERAIGAELMAGLAEVNNGRPDKPVQALVELLRQPGAAQDASRAVPTGSQAEPEERSDTVSVGGSRPSEAEPAVGGPLVDQGGAGGPTNSSSKGSSRSSSKGSSKGASKGSAKDSSKAGGSRSRSSSRSSSKSREG